MIRQREPLTKWELLRLGKFTSSKVACLFVDATRKMTEAELEQAKKEKSKRTTIDDPTLVSDGGMTYVFEKASEIITGTFREMENVYSLEFGKEHEPTAAFILKQKFDDFEYYGKDDPKFFEYTDFSGGSPDGVSRKHKLVAEIKCPENPANHVEFCLLKDGNDLKAFDKDWWHQIQMNIACVAKAWGVSPLSLRGVFISYCPLVKKEFYKRSHIIYIEPCPVFMEKLPRVIERATRKLSETIKQLQKNVD